MHIISRLIFIFIAAQLINPCYSITESVAQKLYEQFESDFSHICYENGYAESIPSNKNSFKRALNKNRPDKIKLKKLKLKEPLPAYEKAAFVTMVKDEEDIVFENLCWHYFMGFRKFIIIENNSTDNTSARIETFKELTAPSTSVIKINEPRIEFRNRSKVNALAKLAETLFPEILWIFSNDIDEFITLDKSLNETLSKIPAHINALVLPRITYVAGNDYFNYPQHEKFYEKIHIAHKENPNFGRGSFHFSYVKTCIRAHQKLLFRNGCHYILEKSPTTAHYASGPDYGLHIREFPFRSPDQALKKIVNVGIAEQENRKTYPEKLYYVDRRYQRYLEVGDAAGMEVFKDFMTKGGYSFDEKMPLNIAVDFAIKSFYNPPKL